MTDHLIDHRYTVLEIERMRLAIWGVLYPMALLSFGMVTDNPGEAEQRVEAQLRTYMLAGIRPEELETRAVEARSQAEARREQMLAMKKEADEIKAKAREARPVDSCSWTGL